MELNEYQEKAMSTCTDSCKNFSYMMLNLVGEVGEFASKVAKAIRQQDAYIASSDHTSTTSRLYFCCDSIDIADYRKHLKLEAGDILWQLAGLCDQMGWNLEDVAKANLDKLASRKQRGKIIGDGDDR